MLREAHLFLLREKTTLRNGTGETPSLDMLRLPDIGLLSAANDHQLVEVIEPICRRGAFDSDTG